MNEDQQTSTATSYPSRIRRAFFVGCLLIVLYVGSFAFNSFLGGYWSEVERDGHDRWSFGLSMPTACLWQPRVGYWAPYRSDWLGAFYSPLIRLDRQFLHPTHYVSDPAFAAWAQASRVSEWHPRFRAEHLAAHAPNQ